MREGRALDSSVYRFRSFAELPLIHGVTTRCESLPGEGDINLAGRLSREEALGNRGLWGAEIGIDATSIVSGRQAHGNGVQIVDRSHSGRGAAAIEDAIPTTDALATTEIGLPLLVYTADCVPAVVYDPVVHALGIAHAGWRGTTSNIAGALVTEMNRAFGSNPADLIVGIGPSIGPCCYEVGDEVIDAWSALGLSGHEAAISWSGTRHHLDLWRANALAFERAGVSSDRIEISGLCTKCHADRFFSRRAGIGHLGLFATIAALRPDPRRN